MDNKVVEFPGALTILDVKVLWSIVAEVFYAMDAPDYPGTALSSFAYRAGTDIHGAARAIKRLMKSGMIEVEPSDHSSRGTKWSLIFLPRDEERPRSPYVDPFDVTLEEIEAAAASFCRYHIDELIDGKLVSTTVFDIFAWAEARGIEIKRAANDLPQPYPGLRGHPKIPGFVGPRWGHNGIVYYVAEGAVERLSWRWK